MLLYEWEQFLFGTFTHDCKSCQRLWSFFVFNFLDADFLTLKAVTILKISLQQGLDEYLMGDYSIQGLCKERKEYESVK